MRKILTLARREYLSTIQTKGFIIGLILMPIFASSGFIAQKLSEKHVDVTDKRITVIDRSGVIAESIVQAAKTRNENELFDKTTGKKARPAYLIEVAVPDTVDPAKQRLELSNRVRAKELHAFVEIGAGIVHPEQGDAQSSRIGYYSGNAAMDEVRQWLSWPINNQLRHLRLADAGIDESRVRDLFNWTNVEGLDLVSVDEGTGKVREAQRSSEGRAIGVPSVMVMLMFFLIILGATPLISTVMEEKSQRIAEVLLGSVQPFEFMMGKILGGVGVSLTALLVYGAGGILAVRFMGYGEYIPYHLLPWFFAFLLLAVFMYGSLLAALGSACSDSNDVKSLSMPGMLPMVIPMMLLMPVLREPSGAFSTWLSLFPPFTPTLMMLRMSAPAEIPLWQPCVGMAGVLLLTLFTVWAGGRIFRIGILMQGKPPRLGEILRWAMRG